MSSELYLDIVDVVTYRQRLERATTVAQKADIARDFKAALAADAARCKELVEIVMASQKELAARRAVPTRSLASLKLVLDDALAQHVVDDPSITET